jgi:hypothetical protein
MIMQEEGINNMLKQDVPNICVGHLAPKQLAEDLILSKARESLQVCYTARIYDSQLIKC